MHIADVFVAAAANVVNGSGQKGEFVIHTCRTPDSSAETMFLTAAAALEPSTTSPMRSRIGRGLGVTWKFESFVTCSPSDMSVLSVGHRFIVSPIALNLLTIIVDLIAETLPNA
jgi:hypothetical protein